MAAYLRANFRAGIARAATASGEDKLEDEKIKRKKENSKAKPLKVVETARKENKKIANKKKTTTMTIYIRLLLYTTK